MLDTNDMMDAALCAPKNLLQITREKKTFHAETICYQCKPIALFHPTSRCVQEVPPSQHQLLYLTIHAAHPRASLENLRTFLGYKGYRSVRLIRACWWLFRAMTEWTGKTASTHLYFPPQISPRPDGDDSDLVAGDASAPGSDYAHV